MLSTDSQLYNKNLMNNQKVIILFLVNKYLEQNNIFRYDIHEVF